MASLSWFLFVFVNFAAVFSGPLKKSYDHFLSYPPVQRFREYLQIDTSQEENIHQAVDFWTRQAKELNLPIAVYNQPQGMPVVVITVEGLDPSLPTIMLNSHMDVVEADETEWEHPPFAAVMDEYGDIFARGAQDTKDVAMQYMEAIRRLKQDNITLLRTLHLTLMPDEETGGYEGIKLFIDTEEFQALNVGFALDEGMSSSEDVLYATYEDRRPWQIQFVVHGEGGHGFTMPDATAAVKVVKLMNVITKYRDVQRNLMRSARRTDYGAYTSININILKGGYAENVIPSKMSVVMDMRLASYANISDIEDLVQEWLKVTGNTTEVSFIRREDVSGTTKLDDSNLYWTALKGTVNRLGYEIKPIICPATSDMLVLRNRGVPAVGFSTKVHTESRIHSKNEYLNVETFLRGIDIYLEVIKSLGNLPKHQESSGTKYNCD
ncbi:hypothetical protein O3G_MSEX011263 [Manduca sexta]|nr:hypothetical protein O3G_MSEX011263 [Manduca sexta]